MAPKPKTGPIDDAERFIIANPETTYGEAARAFGITHNAIRARISNKYGSLAEARLLVDAGIVPRDPRRVLKAIRRCMRCKQSSNIDQGQRMCNGCKKEIAKLHDGGV
jgi:hypothetical protein